MTLIIRGLGDSDSKLPLSPKGLKQCPEIHGLSYRRSLKNLGDGIRHRYKLILGAPEYPSSILLELSELYQT
jgi:hypothetical protein